MNLFEMWCLWLGRSTHDLRSYQSKVDWKSYAESLWNPPSSELKENQEDYMVPFLDHFYSKTAEHFGIKREWAWKGGAPYVVCLTHDIDRTFSSVHGLKGPQLGLTRLLKDGLSYLPGLKNLNAFSNWERQRQWENSHGIKSASYVLFEKRRWLKSLEQHELQHSIGVYQPESIQTELQEYHSAGNEVGLHYSFESWQSESALTLELERLSLMGIKDVTGGRSHYLNFSPNSTLQNLRTHKLKYDSTMGFNYFNGFRCGTSFPFPWNGVWQIPLIVMDSAWRSSGKSQVKVSKVLEGVKSHSGVLMLNWHHHGMNESVFPDEMALLDSVIKKAKEDGAWIVTPREVIQFVEDKAKLIRRHYDGINQEQPAKSREVFFGA